MIEIRGRAIGGDCFATIAGPCAVESAALLRDTADVVNSAGAQFLRAGAYKPRTSPRSFRGLGPAGLPLLAETAAATGMPIVTEVMDARDIEAIAAVADVLQVGARNMQNYALLTELGRAGRPVLLKRGLCATLDELLASAEYIQCEGNPNVILCERGIRTFESSYRSTLDLMAVPVLKRMTRLPVIVDPSHAAGRRDLVEPLSLAAAVVGADGIIVEVHARPDEALCDAKQQLYASDFPRYLRRVEGAARLAGKRTIAPPRRSAPAFASQ